MFVTTAKNLRYQQNLAGRRIAIVVLATPISFVRKIPRNAFVLNESPAGNPRGGAAMSKPVLSQQTHVQRRPRR